MESHADDVTAGTATTSSTGPAAVPPVMTPPIPATAGSLPPPIPDSFVQKPSSGRNALAVGLSVFLALYLADACLSVIDSLLSLLFDCHLVSGARGMVAFLSCGASLLVYVLMGFTPMIPKRAFLPITLFNPVLWLLAVPVYIYFHSAFLLFDVIGSVCQLLLVVGVLIWLRGGLSLGWPLVRVNWIGCRAFGWLNLSGFLAINVLVLPPATLIYLAVCAHLAVDHYSDGFLAVRASGVTVQARKYVRDDGKTVLLVPMVHIGDPDFYWKVSQSFPTNSVILMEGVTDEKHLLTNKVTYQRAAKSLGLAEQQKVFRPTRGRPVRADVDISEFTPVTISMLNVAMLFHSRGLTAETIAKMLQYSPPPHLDEVLIEDLLKKRNRHLLKEIKARLLYWDDVVVPWGAAHIPELAQEIQKTGFRLDETREYQVIRFGSHRAPGKAVEEEKKRDEAER